MNDIEEEIIDEVAGFVHDPEGFINYAFDWGTGELEADKGPREWQREILHTISKELKRLTNSKNKVIKIAVASGHDIGKSALTAFIQLWAMSTFEDTRIQVTANTGSQLKTKTWAELSKWHRLCITRDWFTCTATSFYSNVDDHNLSWRSDAAVWRENKTEAFAGLHNRKKRIVMILDEASGIPQSIYDVIEGSCTDEDTEIIVLAFGNPTRNSGPFREIFGKNKTYWIHRQIDSRTVEGTNKEEINKMVERHGEDSDFVRTRVRGMFPRASNMQFIPTDWVAEAQKRPPRRIAGDPLIMGLDIARGGDDNCVFFFRRGYDAQTIKPVVIPGGEVHNSEKLVAKAIELMDRYKPDAVFGDDTGIGGPILDRLGKLGYNVFHVNFGGESPDKHYYDMTAYMWSKGKEWLKVGGALWNDVAMEDELTQREFDYTADEKLYLESKKDMKKRGLTSPDHADAFMLTFAMPVAPTTGLPASRKHEMKTTLNGYNPLASLRRQRR